jgi:hypothetical protein
VVEDLREDVVCLQHDTRHGEHNDGEEAPDRPVRNVRAPQMDTRSASSTVNATQHVVCRLTPQDGMTVASGVFASLGVSCGVAMAPHVVRTLSDASIASRHALGSHHVG